MNKSKQKNNIIQKNNIKIIALNVNSIVANNRRVNLTEFLKNQNPDITLLGETKSNKRHVLNFENYQIERSDRETSMAASGGTAIIIKNEYKYERIQIKNMFQFKNVEATIVKLKMGNENLYIISIYAAPKSRGDENYDTELREIFEKLELLDPNNYYVIAGDMNGRHTEWKSPRTNYRGEHLKRWLDTEGFMYKAKLLLPNEASFERGNSFVDIKRW